MLASLLLAGCGGPGTAVPYRNVTSQLHPAQFPRVSRDTFTSKAELLDYIKHEMPGLHPHLPAIDWANREAIIVASGPRSSTGYVLHVVSLLDRGGRLVLTVREQTPTLGEAVKAEITYPFVLITIPRTNKKLQLHFQGRP